jgi:hypothetical protein
VHLIASVCDGVAMSAPTIRFSLMATAAAVVLGAAVLTGPGAAARRPEQIPQPPLDKLRPLTRRRLAPDSRRVDLAMPTYSHPTRITNRLFPIGTLRSALILGRFEGKRLRIETTLLPGTRTVNWNGRRVATLQSQFLAFLDGRIYEVAVDKYAQDDSGAVWYFGEDAFGYDKGVVADTADTWLAGVDGPAAMIMPGHPKVGDVYRTENVPGRVFEQVTVKRLGRTVDGPTGRVRGAMVGQELHIEGDLEDKTFAPGYGEFLSGLGKDYEATALAIPADAATGPPPPQLETVGSRAATVFDAAAAGDWPAVTAAFAGVRDAATGLARSEPPARLRAELAREVRVLGAAIAARASRRVRQAALGVTRAGLDLALRHRPTRAVDLARLDLWARQLGFDAGRRRLVSGDVSALGFIRDRLRLSPADAAAIDDQLRYLRAVADAGEANAARTGAARLRVLVGHIRPT